MTAASDSDDRSAPVVAPVPVADRAHRGIWHLESYEVGLNSADLERAIEDLTFATEHAGDHPDRAFWCYCRAIAHVHRVDGGRPDDLSVAIEWCERAFADARETDRGSVAVFLAELYWARYVEHREEPEAAKHLDALIDAVAAVQLDDAEPLVTANLRMMLGTGHAERHQRSGLRPDLDAAIALLAPSVDELPADAAEVAAGALLLGWAYHARGQEDGDPGDLDLAIALVARTAARLDPATESRLVNLRWAQYLFLVDRLERDDNHLDRDEAIRCLRHAAEISPEPDGDLAMALAELLGDRGELYQDADDLASAAVWAGVAANAETNPADGWYPRLWQANAYLARWVQLQDIEDLARSADAMTGAIEAGLPDADLRLIAHRDRLKARYNLDKCRAAAGEVAEYEAAAARAPLVLAADEILCDEPGGDSEVRSDLAAVVLTHQLMLAADDLLSPDIARLRELLRLARSHPSDPHHSQLLAIVDGAIGAYEADAGAGDYGLTSIAEAMAMPEFDTSTTADLRQMMSVTKLLRGSRTGDIRDLDSAVSGLYQARRDTAENQPPGRQLELFQTLAAITRTGIDGDHARLEVAMEQAAALLSAGDAANPMERLLGSALSLPRMVREGAGTVEITAIVDSLPSSAALSGGLFGYHLSQAVRAMAATASVTAAYNHGTAAERAAAGSAFVNAVDAVSGGRSLRGHLLVIAVNLALDLLDQYPDPVLDEAAQRWAAESVAGCAHPSDQSWAPAWFNLARLHRRSAGRDDLARGRAHALSALRGRTWQIVLQYDADYGLEAARRRASDVRLAVQWCRADAEAAAPADRQPILAELVQALDAGRGMVLGVAAAAGAVHDALVARGEPALAAQWLAGERFDHSDPQFDVADLRHRVVTALARDVGDSPETELFAAVTVDEIHAALAAADRDALVYLVASDTAEAGYAVVVSVGGRIDLLALPALRLDDSPLGWYLHTYHGVQVLTGGDIDAWRWSLSQLSSWAWQAGMGPLVEHCRTLAPDCPPRLVLIPIGALSVVPWHAAWRLVDGAERRYAVQDATITYAASARTWCDSAGHPPAGEADNVSLDHAGPALIIADPTGDLPSAADEADSIRRSFYPDATYLGRPVAAAAGAGTPDEVLTWLSAPDAPPATVLHAACHGIVEPDRPSQSHLRLAGGPLRADGLIRLAAAHRRIGTVVLAACTTNVAGEEYDEALTLSTAFLVAGAASVVGSLWAVPSASTGLLMFMLHHFLRAAPGDPGEALRRAQLWMLDPQRRAPDDAADLLRQVNPDRLAEPYRWAGFTHLGR
ncbi:CHAT domain-containing protein [Micromonospora parva]|uniref:CHAT domain-containing protein n=1 Tax=Micromonospora parva TaxID=1464048 RepID=UPI0037A5B3A7